MDYGVEIDWSQPFLSQWAELYKKVPKLALWQKGSNTNCLYANNVYDSKNCYLSYSVVEAEDILYSENIDFGRYIMDSWLCISSELVYENQGSRQFNSKFILQSNDCIDSAFLFDCANCQSCFMSCNLRNKKYVFRNQQLTKESYEKAIATENLSSRKKLDGLRKEWKGLIKGAIHKYSRVVASVNSTGNFVRNAKNTRDSFQIHDIENVAYSMRGLDFKDCMDIYATAHGELIYEGMSCSSGVYGNFFSLNCNDTNNIFYTAHCQSGSNLFGSVGLRKKDYVILNKQFTKEEYNELVPKIKQHMLDMPYIDKKGRIYSFGEFFPIEFSPFGYNETLANEFFALSEAKATQKGFNFYNHKDKSYAPTMTTEEIPDTISETSPGILKQTIPCRHAPNGKAECNQLCTTAFKVTEDEYSFYKRMNIPVPELCPNCRHYERVSFFFEPPKLYSGECMCDSATHDHEGKCKNQFKTPYAPGRPEKLYCESCYNKEIY
ncbi:MAG: hypothetical protein V4486_01100 [Patescibacteria group bacterium]